MINNFFFISAKKILEPFYDLEKIRLEDLKRMAYFGKILGYNFSL